MRQPMTNGLALLVVVVVVVLVVVLVGAEAM